MITPYKKQGFRRQSSQNKTKTQRILKELINVRIINTFQKFDQLVSGDERFYFPEFGDYLVVIRFLFFWWGDSHESVTEIYIFYVFVICLMK